MQRGTGQFFWGLLRVKLLGPPLLARPLQSAAPHFIFVTVYSFIKRGSCKLDLLRSGLFPTRLSAT